MSICVVYAQSALPETNANSTIANSTNHDINITISIPKSVMDTFNSMTEGLAAIS